MDVYQNVSLATEVEKLQYNLFDNIGRAFQINEALVHSHFETIPGLGTFTARCLAGGDAEYTRR